MRLTFGLEVPLVSENLWNRFLNFHFFGNMADSVQNLGHFANFVQNFRLILKKSNIQKYVPQIFRYHIEVPLDQISAF